MVGGRRMRHMVAYGTEDAVVLVHGFGGSLENWRENLSQLGPTGRTVAALDLPGHGESSIDVGSGSLEELATAALGYLDAIGLDRVHLVGHSMGAAICLVLADRVPQRVRSLTLIGPAGIGQKINADFIRGYIGARSRAEVEPLMRLLYADPSHVTEQLLRQAVGLQAARRRRRRADDDRLESLRRHAGGPPVAGRRGIRTDTRGLGCRRRRHSSAGTRRARARRRRTPRAAGQGTHGAGRGGRRGQSPDRVFAARQRVGPSSQAFAVIHTWQRLDGLCMMRSSYLETPSCSSPCACSRTGSSSPSSGRPRAWCRFRGRRPSWGPARRSGCATPSRSSA